MKSVVSLRSDGGAGWTVKVRAGNPIQPVAALGFLWQPEDRAFTTDDVGIALALLDSPDVILLVERDVANAIRNAAAEILVTDGITENVTASDPISVTADATEMSEKRKRGRPPKAEGPMTAAERARRYRRKQGFMRRIELRREVANQLDEIAEETGATVSTVIQWALDELPPHYWETKKVALVRANALLDQRLAEWRTSRSS